MVHATPVPSSGFQALILCGPGESLNTISSNPEENPKCLIPIALRPMVYYPLDWCKRAGIHDIVLITPPSALAPLKAALQQNPYLTSLSSPSPTIIAPKDLKMTTGTAELLRLPEVQACIQSNFLLLSCDLLCDIPGEHLLEAWLASQSELGPAAQGGLSVFYPAKGIQDEIKKEPTDFVAITSLDQDEVPSVSRHELSKLVLSMPMDTLKEQVENDKGLLLRHTLVEKHASVKMLTSYRDAHLYILPKWVRSLAQQQERFESVSEDLIGYWAKAGWQRGLSAKLGIDEIVGGQKETQDDHGSNDGDSLEEEIDLRSMTTTHAQGSESRSTKSTESSVEVPPILAYTTKSSKQLIRRVDSAALVLAMSLRLAKLESVEEVGRAAASPFSHAAKIATPEAVASKSIVTKGDCLLGSNVTVEEKCVIKESCISANAKICSGARLTRCVIMDNAVIGPKCVLTGCIVGRYSQIGKDSVLKDCEIQDGVVVEEETDAKNEQFMSFEGLDDEDDDMDIDGEGDSGDDEGF
ncbi:eukaryotic translation initiation factor 2B, subunit 3 gamma, 58kDa [Aspergillus tubingensis]|uniref:Translation initiation factor eIF2B subunit gamma n=2 Tax=Aspergillus subgen. Circumdati TaxID=2720871 RepID=A0A117DZC1_ASPNG|nr:eukaryotic translation initiation factor subunit eIF2B-gamma [Aspergillus niger]GLA75603.1 eukaryotic translation initiation factor 2B, subunit 3 gamma, 58kDa [Aspergillus tubingensis]GLA86546.1 eukaryotic translation initiation factor 2B, subunit 3 gamma, 58kDa [Aspergillus tubingensis]GLA93516.1 eukaryotic translation initiation factor 2B, subunit 3 gamma, 58kDa [Aspergillus tubingensis]